jgi:flagellar biogenesis protein FliO
MMRPYERIVMDENTVKNLESAKTVVQLVGAVAVTTVACYNLYKLGRELKAERAKIAETTKK